VYCEKPLTHNIHEALTLIKAVRGSKQPHPADRLPAALEQGIPRRLRARAQWRHRQDPARRNQFGTPAKPNANPEEPMEPGLDWDMWCGPSPLAPYSSVLSPRGVHNHFPAWRMTREYGGGMITDWGAHHIDIAQWGLGEDEHGPVEIIAPEKHDEATQGAKLVYASGIPLTHVNNGFGVSFYGETGEVHVNRGKFELVMGGKVVHEFLGKDTKRHQPRPRGHHGRARVPGRRQSEALQLETITTTTGWTASRAATSPSATSPSAPAPSSPATS
jgi:predicted dehydrogenase